MPRPLIPGFLATGQTCALPAQAAESMDIVEITAALGLAKPLLQGFPSIYGDTPANVRAPDGELNRIPKCKFCASNYRNFVRNTEYSRPQRA